MEYHNSEKKPTKLSIPINHQHTKTFSTNQIINPNNKLTMNSHRTTNKNTNNNITSTRLNTIAMSTAATAITPISSRVNRMTPG